MPCPFLCILWWAYSRMVSQWRSEGKAGTQMHILILLSHAHQFWIRYFHQSLDIHIFLISCPHFTKNLVPTSAVVVDLWWWTCTFATLGGLILAEPYQLQPFPGIPSAGWYGSPCLALLHAGPWCSRLRAGRCQWMYIDERMELRIMRCTYHSRMHMI